MPAAGDPGHFRGLRVVLVGTGTEVGKTHVGCALLGIWRANGALAGLKPIETGVPLEPLGPRPSSDDRRLAGSHHGRGSKLAAQAARSTKRGGSGPLPDPMAPSDQERLAAAAGVFHVKRSARDESASSTRAHPLRSLYAFPDPISPHLAARLAGTRIDLGVVERWVSRHAAATTLIETAGGLFSPLGYGATNFDLMVALHPDAVILVAPDRLGVLHELTTTLALAAARGGPSLGVVLSTPAKRDASTGRNAPELAALGIATPIATFPRAAASAALSADAARQVIAWVENARMSGGMARRHRSRPRTARRPERERAGTGRG